MKLSASCRKNIDDLHTLAEGLLEYETLTGEEIEALLRGEAPQRDVFEEPEKTAAPTSSVPSAGKPKRSGPLGGIGGKPEPPAGNVTPRLYGILNVTEDSFSDGGRYFAFEDACAHADSLIEGGADVIDIGAASSNPDANPIEPDG